MRCSVPRQRRSRRFLSGLARGDLRQGALESLVVDALARAAELPLADVRRAVMLRGSPGPVAQAILAPGVDGTLALQQIPARGGTTRPTDAGPDRAERRRSTGAHGPAAVEWKLDGIRVQVHKVGDDVRVFTRTLDEIGDRLPEVVEVVRGLAVSSAVLDGEAIALRPDGRPLPFQVTGSRVGSKVDVDARGARHR